MLVEHDLFGKPASTFPDHALAALLGVSLELRLQRRELGEWRIRVGRFLAPLEAFDRWALAFALRAIILRTILLRTILAMVRPAAVTRVTSFPGRRAGRSWRRLG